jgi:hypothetical protein
MRKLAGVLVLMSALLSAGSAQAATEVGGSCTDPHTVLVAGIEAIVFPLESASPSALPPSSPIAGVATQWTVRSGSTDTFDERLKVLRTVPDSDTVQVIADTPLEPINKDSGSFPIRVPVQAGDRFGVSGQGALACNTGNEGDVVGATHLNVAPGQSERFSRLSGYQLALSVRVEPDADGDGYGDETQDGCPTLSAFQVPCPPLSLSATRAVEKRAILVDVTTNNDSSAQAYGQVSWKVRQPGGGDRGLTVGLSAGPARTVAAGTTLTLRVPLTKAVKRRLARLTPRQILRAKLTVVAADAFGGTAQQSLVVRLHGRG